MHGLAQLLNQHCLVRLFAPAWLTLAHIGQLLWAVPSATVEEKLRIVPSALEPRV